MKVYIKNKFISLGGSSTVYDENQKPIYKVQGKIISPTRKKIIKDMNGKRLFIVRNKFFRLFVNSAYIYDSKKKKVGKVKDKFINMHKAYTLVGGEHDIRTEGEFFSLSTTIYRDDVPIGRINRQITLVADAFSLEADNPEDMPFLVALVIAIDNIVDRTVASR